MDSLEEVPLEQLQKILAGGYLDDLLEANVDWMNRDDFRKACGLIPFSLRKTDLLRPITKILVPGAKRFVAEEHLKTANIGWTGDKFNKLFLKKG